MDLQCEKHWEGGKWGINMEQMQRRVPFLDDNGAKKHSACGVQSTKNILRSSVFPEIMTRAYKN